MREKKQPQHPTPQLPNGPPGNEKITVILVTPYCIRKMWNPPLTLLTWDPVASESVDKPRTTLGGMVLNGRDSELTGDLQREAIQDSDMSCSGVPTSSQGKGLDVFSKEEWLVSV